jgi:hypothetical protein|tara:strand:+ start:60 stop:398 length:339 start_codon:yes stop_codon:yes gene_type:complete
MSIKLSLLKSGETLISEMKELVAEDKEQAHAYLLENPHTVQTREKSFLTEEEKKTGDFGIDVIMMPWIILSADKKIIIPIDVVTTIVEPIASVKQMFIDKCEAFKITEETND